MIPSEQHTLTARGALSSRGMPTTRGHLIYQDFVCGSALRVCREVFASLPVVWVGVTVRTWLLNSSTGHLEQVAVLSLVAPRPSIDALRFDALDPSDAMTNFLHRMGFKRNTGTSAITPFLPDDIPLTSPL